MMKRVVLSLILGLALPAARVFAQTPTVTSIGPEEYVASTYMEHPAIATDSKAQPHMVADFGVGNSFMKFHRVNGKWTGGVFATGARGGRYDASRLYIGQIEIDSRDRAWISCKLGVKEYGDMYGQGLWLFNNVDQNAWPKELFFRFVCVYKGMGLVSTDTKYPDEGVMLGTFGNWERINQYGSSLGKGSFGIGNGGEKVRFRIASYKPRFSASAPGSGSDGIWHTAMNGYSQCPSQYQNSLRYKSGYGPVTWAEYRSYPRMSDDYAHPGLGIDLENPRMAYIGSVYSRGLVVNIWNGERMLFNPFALKVIDLEADFEGRLGVQFAPALSGGTFIFWSADNVIKMVYMSQRGVTTTPRYVTAGRSPGVTTDRYGNIHLVYYDDGIKYRKIKVTTLRPLEPEGRVDSRTPRFRWTDTQAAHYTIQLSRDGAKLPVQTVSSNAWRPSSELRIGRYTWKVKEGRADSANPWSNPVEFEIPPAVPAPESPAARFEASSIKPLLTWTGSDPDATHFQLQVFQGQDLLKTLVTTGAVSSFRWSPALDAGSYAWRVRAVCAKDGSSVASAWSPLLEFQVAVPTATRFTRPQALEQFDPGWQTITCAWNTAEGAASYTLRVLHNGTLLDKVEGIKSARHSLAKAFQPGYYSLVVKGVNADGSGPWSPVRTFIVTRQMTPGDGRTLAMPPKAFEWTRNRTATRYLAKLAKYDKGAGKFLVLREKWVAQPPQGDPIWILGGDPLSNGSYRWSVTDYTRKKQGYTSADYFQVRLPGTPEIVSPKDDAAGHRLLPFQWFDASAFGEEFQVQVWKDGARIREMDWTSATLVQGEKGLFLKVFSLDDGSAGAHTWRVRARNSFGSSPWRQATFNLTPLPAPVVTSPASGGSGAAGAAVPFTWQPVAGAEWYRWNVEGPSGTASATVSGTNWFWTPPEAGSYTLDVRAGATGWSRPTTLTFTAY